MSFRRKFLQYTVVGMAGVGLLGSLVPFSKSWNIRKGRIRDFNVEVDISTLKEGDLIRTEWMGKVVHIYRRTPEDFDFFEIHESRLRDPKSQDSEQPEAAKNKYRSIDPSIFVYVPFCTHLGCKTIHSPDAADLGLDEEEWSGGYFCPCHGSKFDSAGRVFKGVPAPVNLEIPPYGYEKGKLILGLGYEV
ncbi:ubiquinol-cytochrome c reductase iron-sulfur subunit [Microbulbifer sp. SSSA002]|uniref:ubiquinol-cytochrome c reductase iron-sulfur subunit n=1 Tax=unclassified Microbulbifer TaxID=2619833 RepID=UPI004039289A